MTRPVGEKDVSSGSRRRAGGEGQEDRMGGRGKTRSETHLLALSREDDDGGEDEGDERERSDGGEELGLVELLRFDKDEEAASEKCEGERDACSIEMGVSEGKAERRAKVDSPRKAATLRATVT